MDTASLAQALRKVSMHTHSYLPIAAAYCRMLNLREVVDGMVDTRMELSPGIVVQAMVLDVLNGRSPLYRIEQFVEQQHRELLLGEEIDPHLFNDTNIARSLDALFAAGPSKIITELGIRAAQVFELDMHALSYDTTSTSVWGEYRGSDEEGTPGPAITFGHSKDQRPDLKQFMTELLCVDRGVPIAGSSLDGNSSDKKSNNAMLTRISSLLARHGLGAGACIYVADSAMVTEENLRALGELQFISRLPATYSACSVAIDEAVATDNWIPFGTMAETVTGKNRPPAEYKGYETTVSLYEKPYRGVVVHSSAHDKRRQKKIKNAIKQSLEALKGKLKKVQVRYFCREDAKVAAANLRELSSPLHALNVTVNEVAVRRRGRPPKDGTVPMDLRYELSWEITAKEEKLQVLQEQAGCFVMLTNVPLDSLDAASVLRTYRGQYGIESDFSFLKDPLVVNDLFLKTPSRIDALGMILIIALMIWRLMERQMRLYLAEQGTTVPGWDNKPTARPTSFMMSTVFAGIMAAELAGVCTLVHELTPRQTAFLSALGLDERVFYDKQVICVLTRRTV
ncbi:MAG: IS1634 family transposase [Spirochaetia bacterium]|nr:IS1634 family transposase [Spirochaetia bacterium]